MSRPNIVWLLTDHHVFDHHRTRGETPPRFDTLDRLSCEGIRFDQANAVCPLCTPARASMLTGVYPHRHGMLVNNGELGSRLDFDADQRLFGHFLRDAGYRVGYFGKWHCGNERLPTDLGFEGWSLPGYGFPYNTDRFRDYLARHGLPNARVRTEWNVREGRLDGQEFDLVDGPRPPEYGHTAGVLTSPVETHEAWFVTDLAMDWLEEAAQADDPFCLRVDVWGPHQPYLVAAPFADRVDPARIPEYPSFGLDLSGKPANHRECYDFWDCGVLSGMSWADWRPVLARCYEHAMLVDAAMGRVVDALDRLGLADDTLVIYTADHGDLIGAHGGSFDKGCLMVEETMRIPLALRWPGRIGPGASSDALVSNMDIVPTVLEAAGADAPSPCDGASLLGLAQEPATTPWREALMCQSHGHYKQIRVQRMLRRGRFKYVAHLDDLDELYDLQQDPFELTNRIGDPALADELASLRRTLAAEMDRFEDSSDDTQRLRRQMGVDGRTRASRMPS